MVAGYERGVPGGIHTRENKKSLDILRLYCTANSIYDPSPAACKMVKMTVFDADARGQCRVELEAQTLKLEKASKNEWVGGEPLPCDGHRHWSARWEVIPKRACKNAWNLEYTEAYPDSDDANCAYFKRKATTSTYMGADSCSTPLPNECKTIVVGHGQRSEH